MVGAFAVCRGENTSVWTVQNAADIAIGLTGEASIPR